MRPGVTPFTQPTAQVIQDSVSQAGKRLVTFTASYQRFIHAEAKTHRVLSLSGEEYELTQDAAFMSDRDLSRNAASSRAIPVAKMIEQVRYRPAMPAHWGKNQPGMQAEAELDALVYLEEAIEHDNPSDVPLFTFERRGMTPQEAWLEAAWNAANVAEAMAAAGYHKQVVNRILEPFQIMHVIVSMTEDENFYELRDHKDAEPNIQLLARAMLKAKGESTPVYRAAQDAGNERGWHLPYVTPEERQGCVSSPEFLANLSAARCARVSYLNHDGSAPVIQKDLELFQKLVGSKPLHASPVEHQAHALWSSTDRSGNFLGWAQYRKTVESRMAEIETATEA